MIVRIETEEKWQKLMRRNMHRIRIFQLVRYSIFRRHIFMHRIKKRYEKRYVFRLSSKEVRNTLRYFITIIFYHFLTPYRNNRARIRVIAIK